MRGFPIAERRLFCPKYSLRKVQNINKIEEIWATLRFCGFAIKPLKQYLDSMAVCLKNGYCYTHNSEKIWKEFYQRKLNCLASVEISLCLIMTILCFNALNAMPISYQIRVAVAKDSQKCCCAMNHLLLVIYQSSPGRKETLANYLHKASI